MASIGYPLIQHRVLVIWLVTVTLFMMVVVPAWYMSGTAHAVVSVELCPASYSLEPMGMPSVEHSTAKGKHGRPEVPYTFAGLIAPCCRVPIRCCSPLNSLHRSLTVLVSGR